MHDEVDQVAQALEAVNARREEMLAKIKVMEEQADALANGKRVTMEEQKRLVDWERSLAEREEALSAREAVLMRREGAPLALNEQFEGGEREERIAQSLVGKVEDVPEPVVPAVGPEAPEAKEGSKEAAQETKEAPPVRAPTDVASAPKEEAASPRPRPRKGAAPAPEEAPVPKGEPSTAAPEPQAEEAPIAEAPPSQPMPDITCPSCSTINDGSAKRCYACGQRLDEDSIKAFEAKRAARQAEEARKEAERKASTERKETEHMAEEKGPQAEGAKEGQSPQPPTEEKKPVSIRKIIKRK
jgi:hypothetical protein